MLSAERWAQDDALANTPWRCADRGVYEALMFISKAAEKQDLTLAMLLADYAHGYVLQGSDILQLVERHFIGDRQKALIYQARLLLRVD